MAKTIWRLFTWNGGLLRRNTTQLRLSSGDARKGSDSLHFWSHYHGENLWKRLEKSSKLYRFWESTRELDASLVEDDEQSKWIDCWKTLVFYRHSNGRDTQRASWAQLEPDRRPKRHLHLHLEPSNTISCVPRAASQRGPRRNINQGSRLYIN